MRNGIPGLRSSSRTDGGGPTFAIEHFGWGAPDRLEVAGTFTGLASEPLGGAMLTVEGEDGAHRLPAVDGEAGPPADGVPWTAEFAWLEAPVTFERARLELGASLAVELPAPGAATGDPLMVEVLDEPDEPAPPADAAAEPLETRLVEQFRDALAQVRGSTEDELAAARAELAEARSELDAVRGELDAVRGELDSALGRLSAAQADAQALVERLSGRR